VGSLLKNSKNSKNRLLGGPVELPTFTEGCDIKNSSWTLDVNAIARNHTRPENVFFYIPDGEWDDILYSTSYHLYALSGFLICLIVCLVVSLISRICMREYRSVEPMLLHPLVRSKDSMSMSEMSRNSHPHPYVLSQMQPYYGPNHHRNSQNNQNSQYPVSQSEWDDTHFRWPSPSLPPTLKKGQNKHHFGTLDKGDLIRQSSPEKSISNNGKINYGFNRSSPDGDFERKHPDQFSTSSTNDSDDMTVDDFGDVVKRRKSSSHSSSNKSSHHSRSGSSKPRTIVRQSSEDDDEDEDGWTTEF